MEIAAFCAQKLEPVGLTGKIVLRKDLSRILVRTDRGFGGEMSKKSRTSRTHHRSNHLHFDDEVKIRLRVFFLRTQLSLIVPYGSVGSGLGTR
jgi:hypothetical protein